MPSAIDSRRRYSWRYLLLTPVWVLIGFVAAVVITKLIFLGLARFSVFTSLNPAVQYTLEAACVYVFALAVVLLLPAVMKRPLPTRKQLGLDRLPRWFDILLAPAGLVVYFLTSTVVMFIVQGISSNGINFEQSQDVGFSNLTYSFEYILAFLTLVVVAPLAEETLFRGYLYGKLRLHIPRWLAILTTSALFGLVHAQWNVGLDVFALSLVLCSLREVTGSIWAGVLLHMLKNGVAFYLLFINPSFLSTLGLS